ncbi:MAG: zinc-ribbon domain-containing protein [Collinsella sp.]
MFCQKCGQQVPDGSTFCTHCGGFAYGRFRADLRALVLLLPRA